MAQKRGRKPVYESAYTMANRISEKLGRPIAPNSVRHRLTQLGLTHDAVAGASNLYSQDTYKALAADMVRNPPRQNTKAGAA